MKINWDKVRERRTELNMTMEDLGRAIGVQRSAINKYEKGQIKSISLEMFEKLTAALQVSPGYLLDAERFGQNGPRSTTYAAAGSMTLQGTDAAPATGESIDLVKFKNDTVGDQVKTILEVWSKAKPATKRMILPVLEELNKLEKEED